MGSFVFAGYPFDIRFTKGEQNYKDFYSAEKCENLSTITVCDYKDISVNVYGVEYFPEKDYNFFRSQTNPSSVMFANSEWTDVKICRGNNRKYSEELMTTAVYSKLCEKDVLLMHGSFVELDGNGIIFTGPSGIGKTTQAELWQKYLNANIINGDKVFVRVYNNEISGYGAPWSGSSPYCLNKKAQLKGIVVLLQSDKNRITKLDCVEATTRVMPHIFMHHWDERCVVKVLSTIDKVLKNTSVWLLECKPDQEAVMITKNAILNNN